MRLNLKVDIWATFDITFFFLSENTITKWKVDASTSEANASYNLLSIYYHSV